MDANTIKDHLKKRLYESALNNVGIMISADYVFQDIAENRIETWIDELYQYKFVGENMDAEKRKCMNCVYMVYEEGFICTNPNSMFCRALVDLNHVCMQFKESEVKDRNGRY